MKRILMLLFIIQTPIYAQSNKDILKNIEILEDIFYFEGLNSDLYQKINVNHSSVTNKITFLQHKSFATDEILLKNELYVEDIDLDRTKFNIIVNKENQTCLVVFILITKGKSIRFTELNPVNNLPISNTEYVSNLIITNVNSLPQNIAVKYMRSITQLIGVENEGEIAVEFKKFNK